MVFKYTIFHDIFNYGTLKNFYLEKTLHMICKWESVILMMAFLTFLNKYKSAKLNRTCLFLLLKNTNTLINGFLRPRIILHLDY